MTSEGVAIARELLDRLKAGIAARDTSAVNGLCPNDVVLFGTARANFGPDSVGQYLGMVVESNSMIRWHFDRESVVHHAGDHLLVASSGQVEFEADTGPERSGFRL